MPYLSIDDVHIYYEYDLAKQAHESTNTVVFIHGLGFDLRCWDLIIPYFADDFHILRYDFRGHGLSISEELAMEDPARIFTDHLYRLLAHLQIDTFHIVGHGVGSIIPLYFASFYPGRILSNTLISIPLFTSINTAHKYTNYRKELITYRSMEALADHVISNVTLHSISSAEVEQLLSSFAKVTTDTYFELLNFFINTYEEILNLFKHHTVPTLILTGEKDPMYPPFLSSLIAAVNPHSRYMTIFDASNLVFLDRPEETYKQILSFLQMKNSESRAVDPLLATLHADFFEVMHQDAADTELSPLPSHLTVNLMNKFEVMIDGSPVVNGWSKRKAKELLIYLVFHPKVSRDRLCEDLWPNMEITKSRNLLRVCLNHLKQLLDNDRTNLVYIDNKQLILSAPVQCDLLALMGTIKSAMAEKDESLKKELIDDIFLHVDGDLFQNFNEDWGLSLRTKTEIHLITLANHQLKYLEEQGNSSEAIVYARFIAEYNAEEDSLTSET
ncbi:alpha/beta fold hydrolase [Paenibacillus tepidiphilus]|uniref:alpha/beta fold hydrolase n=1 Tax=Paenibacillus tepidiphilus TaxID=2608683 RepID=UPI00123C4866|nr:alpha/beta fold hydrolase [Paenibacillus tepidiphilus]